MISWKLQTVLDEQTVPTVGDGFAGDPLDKCPDDDQDVIDIVPISDCENSELDISINQRQDSKDTELESLRNTESLADSTADTYLLLQLECQSVIADPQDQQANRNLES